MRYLIEMYGEKDAIQIFVENKSKIFNYHGLAWSLGKQNLKYFCEIFLHDLLFDYSGEKIPLSKTHYEIWDEVQDMMLNQKNTRTVYVMPRGFGKTTTIMVPLAIWTAMYGLHTFTLIQSDIQKRADQFIADVKAQIEENTLMKSAFGEYINKNYKYNSSEIELDIKPTATKIQGVSAGTNVRGIMFHNSRPGLLLEDDGQDDDDVKSPESRAYLVDRFDTTVMKSLQSQNYHVVALGTVQRVNDLYDTLLKRPTWKSRIQKCVPIDDIDGYFRGHPHWVKCKEILLNANNPNAYMDAMNYYYDNKSEMDFPVIWEKYECFPLFCEWLENNTAFKQEYQCDIYNLGERRIHTIAALPEDEIGKNTFHKTILSIDPAGTNTKKSDYYAFCILSEGDSYYTDTNGYRHCIRFARKSIIGLVEKT